MCFHCFVFSMNALEKHRFDDEKNWTKHVFHVFYRFFVTQKLPPGKVVLGIGTCFWAGIGGLGKSPKTENLEKLLFQFRPDNSRQNMFWNAFFMFFFHFPSPPMFAQVSPRMVTPAQFFPYEEPPKRKSGWPENHVSTSIAVLRARRIF